MIENAMKFSELLEILTVPDKGDDEKALNEAIQQEYESIIEKINTYSAGGVLTIKLKFTLPKNSNNQIIVIPEVISKQDKRKKDNRLYRDATKKGLFVDNPDQTHLFDKKEIKKKGTVSVLGRKKEDE